MFHEHVGVKQILRKRWCKPIFKNMMQTNFCGQGGANQVKGKTWRKPTLVIEVVQTMFPDYGGANHVLRTRWCKPSLMILVGQTMFHDYGG